MRRFEGRTAMVTGAAHGIGAGVAARLIAEGAQVAAIDREPIAIAGVFAVQGDCTDATVLADFAAAAEQRLGPVDVLVNNVGQSARERGSPFLESHEEVWRFVLDVSLLTTMRLTRLVAPGMRERGFGRVVNISSDSAFVGDVGLADYATAKMGLVGFTRSLARELAPHGVTVNVVAPGAVRTRAHDRLPAEVIDRVRSATPAGFVAEPEDVAGLVAYLASPEARFVTGQTILIDGGRWML
ncbi:SDR family NAD(P)-dependent oxidoreductase [Limobrevibacterium gyesilva]|uniref:SDR family oxidoreductase n=1 Tax=Limobrevibacterium gyesilva TaxID=2991712 RepID=A0AA41YST7_9PROT|nr:SDR family oxidoreductase [Limobrevibacterium gyesilva]MCW3475855.1 SDR family oxidoreductase [Limobrevibacterium gyesilva]